MLKEKRIREVRLSQKELEVKMWRDDVKAMEEASRKRCYTEAGNVNVLNIVPPPLVVEDLRGNYR
jgi:hypothetical protein